MQVYKYQDLIFEIGKDVYSLIFKSLPGTSLVADNNITLYEIEWSRYRGLTFRSYLGRPVTRRPEILEYENSLFVVLNKYQFGVLKRRLDHKIKQYNPNLTFLF